MEAESGSDEPYRRCCFAGIGGLDLGLRAPSMSVRWQVEIDEFCRRVLAKHWPDVRRHDDINTAIDAGRPVDLIGGGVPCQPWSVAGKKKGQDDARDLWPAFWKLCLLLRPRFIVVEEVPGFAVPGGLGRALTDLARAGYSAEWFHLSAAEVGALTCENVSGRWPTLTATGRCEQERPPEGRVRRTLPWRRGTWPTLTATDGSGRTYTYDGGDVEAEAVGGAGWRGCRR